MSVRNKRTVMKNISSFPPKGLPRGKELRASITVDVKTPTKGHKGASTSVSFLSS